MKVSNANVVVTEKITEPNNNNNKKTTKTYIARQIIMVIGSFP